MTDNRLCLNCGKGDAYYFDERGLKKSTAVYYCPVHDKAVSWADCCADWRIIKDDNYRLTEKDFSQAEEDIAYIEKYFCKKGL